MNGAAGTGARYSPAAKILHWLIVLAVAGQFFLGWNMPEVEEGAPPGAIIDTHMSLGVSILLVTLIRLAWRISHPVRQLPELPAWQRHAAVTVHRLFYAILIVMPFLGWLAAAGEGWQVTVFGIFLLPVPVAAESPLGEAGHEGHEILGTVLLILIGIHAAAAVYHYVILRDRVMRRMLPGG